MNKKILMFALPILAIGLVAAITYYTVFSASITITQPIDVKYDGNSVFGQDVGIDVPDCDAGETCLSTSPIEISNNGDKDRIVKITNPPNEDVEVSYVGKMQFVKKSLVDWTTVSGETEEIEYTITGEDFVVSGIPEEKTLIYYPNTEGDTFPTNIANIKVLVEGINNIESLPIELDVGDDYCNIGEPDFNSDALVCRGAKLWLIPKVLTLEDARVMITAWNTNAPNFLFETDLITYMDSTTGEVLVPINSTITIYPAFTPDTYITNGTTDIKITVA